MKDLLNFDLDSFDIYAFNCESDPKTENIYSILTPIRDLSWALACLELD